MELTNAHKNVLREQVRDSILSLGFRSTVERLMAGGYSEGSAIQFVREVHDAIEQEGSEEG